MPRNGSDVYSFPAGTDAVTGQTISSTKYNTRLDDIAADLNLDRPVAAGGTGASTAADARTNLGLVIGTDVQAYDAGLLSIAGLTTAADKMIYTTASDTYAVADLSAFGRTLIDDATAGAALTTLGVSAFAQTILDDADASAVRTTIGAGTGNGDLLASNNLSDVASSATARSNIGAYGSGDDPTFGDVTADTVASHVPIGGQSTGTLDATNLGHGINLSGNITIPTGIGSGQQTIGPLNSGGASRTITRGSGLSMYVNGVNVASCTLAARGLAVIWFQSSTFCYVIGDVY